MGGTDVSWAVGYDANWKRDIGYGVPAICDYPGCGAKIDRGLANVCGGESYGGEHGCGLFFCGKHLSYNGAGIQLCKRCTTHQSLFTPTPDTLEWLRHKMTDPSWCKWRVEQGLEPAMKNEVQ